MNVLRRIKVFSELKVFETIQWISRRIEEDQEKLLIKLLGADPAFLTWTDLKAESQKDKTSLSQ